MARLQSANNDPQVQRQAFVSSPNVERRLLDFRSWPELLAEIDHLREAGYRRLGNWDLSQILEHVGEGMRTAVHGIEHRAPWIFRKFIGPLVLSQILRKRRVRAGIRVPSWWQPGPTHDESEAVACFRSRLAEFEALKTEPFPHPFFGPMSKVQWNDLVLVHGAHHLGFLMPNR